MMSKVNLAPIEITIDASEAMKQVGELTKLLKLPARSFQGIPEHGVNLFSNRVRGLINNIVPGNLSTAFSTKDINEICIKVKIVGPLEHLTTAIRTNGLHSLHEYILSTIGEFKD